ncbi:HAMP domain-containing histidine kinase [Solimonas marina]|uniref:histidine kinase n=1 Tax=Solimonas marina TaxID=2714601 RepID=A0A970BAK4_9GAMM|nr:HAMP domain-containing histidine kinase [Solimonas marina]NKF23466.1 HAMP domain-containing histidine kinase [Solimonas marina]
MNTTATPLSPWPAGGAAPLSHWTRVAMPGAPVYRFDAGALSPCDDGETLELDAALQAQLTAAPDAALLMAMRGDVPWRLRRCRRERSLWFAQPLADSRQALLSATRSYLASRLSAQLLHDLRNPMNALSLHTDLMSRLVASAETAGRASGSLQVVRERLNDLSARQNAMVELWLAPVADDVRAPGLQILIERVLRMIRSHYALHEIRGRAAGLERLAACEAVTLDARLEIVLIGLLLLACDNLVMLGSGVGEIVIEALDAADGAAMPDLWIRAPMAKTTATAGFGGASAQTVADVVDGFALLLDGSGVSLQLANDGQALRFVFAA